MFDPNIVILTGRISSCPKSTEDNKALCFQLESIQTIPNYKGQKNFTLVNHLLVYIYGSKTEMWSSYLQKGDYTFVQKKPHNYVQTTNIYIVRKDVNYIGLYDVNKVVD